MAENPRRNGKGRQKLELVKMEKESNLLVTFSKRHQGICRKVHELSTLTGAQAAIIGFSPKGKPFSFGCPSVPCILEKYQNPGAEPITAQPNGRDNSQKYLSEEIMSLEGKLREEKKRAENIDARIRQRPKYWWEAPTEKLTLEQSEKYMMDLLSLRAYLSNGMANHQLRDLQGYYVPTTDLRFPQYAAALPSSINGGNLAGGASLSTAAGCSSNSMAYLSLMEFESATASQFLGPSSVNTNVQPIQGGKSSIDFHDYGPLLPCCHDESVSEALF